MADWMKRDENRKETGEGAALTASLLLLLKWSRPLPPLLSYFKECITHTDSHKQTNPITAVDAAASIVYDEVYDSVVR